MTTAQSGLAKALARSASGEVIALAEMSVADILASMSEEKKAELSASLVPQAKDNPKGESDAEDAAEGPEGDESDAEDAAEGDEPTNDPKKGGMGKGKAGDDRVKAVAAAVANDDACKGKAALALQMLADDDFASLNAAAMVKLIGQTPVEGASAGDPESAARAEMRDQISKNKNSNVDASASSAPGTENHSAGWSKAVAEINRRNGFTD